MRRFDRRAALLAAIVAFGCGRTPTLGVVSTPSDAGHESSAALPDAASDKIDAATPDVAAEVTDIQLADTANVPDIDLCGPENAQLPNEGEVCDVEGATVCGKADAFSRATPWKPKGADASTWAAVVPDWMCWRPQILRCAKQSDGALRWEGEWCSMPYQPGQSAKALEKHKGYYHCQSFDGVASCCPLWQSLAGSSLLPCDPANSGMKMCTYWACGIAANQSDLTPQAHELLSKSPDDLKRCLMWWPTVNQCGIVECSVKNPNPSWIDAPYLCQSFSGGCKQIDDYTFACDESGCGGLNPPLPQGNCKGYHKDVVANGPDASP